MFVFEEGASLPPFVHSIWRTRSEHAGAVTSIASIRWEMVVTKREDRTMLTVRGPETTASRAAFAAGTEWFGITFKPGTFMPSLPPSRIIDRKDSDLPEASRGSFWLDGSAWEYPSFEHADTFVNRLVEAGLLVRDPVVEAGLQGRRQDLSARAVQYRFRRATGLTHQAIRQIERARTGAALLAQGVSIPNVIHDAGYYDQSHLTRSLRRFIGLSPAQLATAHDRSLHLVGTGGVA